MTLTHFRGFLPLLYCGSSVSVSQKLALIIKGTLWSKTLLTKMSVNVSVFCTETNYMTCKFKASCQDNVFEKAATADCSSTSEAPSLLLWCLITFSSFLTIRLSEQI